MGFFLGFGCVAVPEGLISRVRLASYSPQRMNVAVGDKAHVFASHVHFCGSYPDGGTLGYQALRHGHTPKAEKEPTMGSVSAAFYVKVLLLHNKSSGQEAHSALRKYGC